MELTEDKLEYIAFRCKKNIVDGRLIYTRHKTGKLIKAPLQPQAVDLIEKYSIKRQYLPVPYSI